MPSIQYFQKTENVKSSFTLKPVVYGTVTSALVCGLLIVIAAAVFLYGGISQKFIPIVSKCILILSVLAGGVAAGINSKIMGWLYGAVTGLSLCLLLIATNVVIGANIEHSYFLYIIVLSCTLISGIGGIIGINLKPRRKH